MADGEHVRVTSACGQIEVAVAADAGTPMGTAFLAANRSAPGAADLVDLGEAVTELRVETLR